MDVELYVYDLSKGLARQMSMAFLGTHIDAVYHTSLVFGNVEYFFGAGIQTCYPGTTHHGQPMQRFKLGKTELDADTIAEYLESLKTVYTPESYDLFMHNCNNFSNDFATFLVGKGIPDHITSLPQTVLNTPFGQMLKPQLDQAMRGITQAPVPASNVPSSTPKVKRHGETQGKVHNITQLQDLEALLEKAQSSCATIFFTSSTCAPCKIYYEPFDRLAEEVGSKAVLIKVDINFATEIASSYQIRATPTFITFARGDKIEQWAGADPAKLTANVRLAVHMAHPAHPHSRLVAPTFQRRYEKSDLYTTVPPLDKMVAKLGSIGDSTEVQALKSFVQGRQKNPADQPLPDLTAISAFIRTQVSQGQTDNIFALVDLFRVALADPRLSGFFAEEVASASAVMNVISAVCDWATDASSPTKLVSVQLACNTFSSPLMIKRLATDEHFSSVFVRLCTWLLLDESRIETRKGAANLALNMLRPLHAARLDAEDTHGTLSDEAQLELAACLLESIQREEDGVTLKRLLLALGLLVYGGPLEGDVHELLTSMGAADVLQEKTSIAGGEKALIEETIRILA